MWQQFQSIISENIEQILPKKTNQKKKKWMTNEIVSVMEKRRVNKNKDLLYRQINKEIRKKCAEAKDT